MIVVKLVGSLVTWRRPRLGREGLDYLNETFIPIHHHNHQSLFPISYLHLFRQPFSHALVLSSALPSMVENPQVPTSSMLLRHRVVRVFLADD